MRSCDECAQYVVGDVDDKPQTLLFSATVPHWVQKTARKYLRHDIVKLDLVGQGSVRTATSVEVCCCRDSSID